MAHHTHYVDGAIARSIRNDETVTVYVTDIQSAYENLIRDDLAWDWDYVDTRGGQDNKPLREIWGNDERDNDWRVHLQMT